MKKRLLSILLVACLLMGLLSTVAFAEGGVTYRYLDTNGNWQSGTIAAGEYIVVESGTTTWSSGRYYVVNRDVTINSRVTVNGNVHLILVDGCTLTASKGIQVTGDDSLTIYGQENGTGALITTGDDNKAGIGGSEDNSSGMIGGGIDGGTVTIHGGTVTIHGGTVEATGGKNAAGIGGGGSDRP